jgi:hypothetical protein
VRDTRTDGEARSQVSGKMEQGQSPRDRSSHVPRLVSQNRHFAIVVSLIIILFVPNGSR